MNDYIAPGWKAIFGHNRMLSFKDFWKLKADWFEPPNQRRGGWSGVSRMLLADPDDGEQVIFLKRQENHTRKTWRHPLAGEPTFREEARNLRFLNGHDIAAPELLYYAECRSSRGWQVVLATRELADFMPLDELIEHWRQHGWQQHRDQRQRIISQVAGMLQRLHSFALVHGALYPKHIFAQPDTGQVCLIDLEKMRRRMYRSSAMLRDLDTCNRRTWGVSRSDRLRFLLQYLQREKPDAYSRKIWWKLVALEKRKGGCES